MAWFNQVQASTKRSVIVTGKKPEVTDYLEDVMISEPDVVDPERRGELKKGLNIETPNALVESFTEELYDIIAGDRVVITETSKTYVVRGVANWKKIGSMPAYMRLIMEDQATLA
jgi:hypothetical protein